MADIKKINKKYKALSLSFVTKKYTVMAAQPNAVTNHTSSNILKNLFMFIIRLRLIERFLLFLLFRIV